MVNKLKKEVRSNILTPKEYIKRVRINTKRNGYVLGLNSYSEKHILSDEFNKMYSIVEVKEPQIITKKDDTKVWFNGQHILVVKIYGVTNVSGDIKLVDYKSKKTYTNNHLSTKNFVSSDTYKNNEWN